MTTFIYINFSIAKNCDEVVFALTKIVINFWWVSTRDNDPVRYFKYYFGNHWDLIPADKKLIVVIAHYHKCSKIKL